MNLSYHKQEEYSKSHHKGDSTKVPIKSNFQEYPPPSSRQLSIFDASLTTQKRLQIIAIPVSERKNSRLFCRVINQDGQILLDNANYKTASQFIEENQND